MSTATQPAATIDDLAPGRRATSSPTAVVAMSRSIMSRARVDAGGTRLRLRALHVMGHGSARIARAIGAREMTIRALTRGDTTAISPQLRDTIADLYDSWWDKRAPERTRAERAAATAARRRAEAGNWCAPVALDDDQLDIPGYRPRSRWRPATGTGVAPDTYVRRDRSMRGRAVSPHMNVDLITDVLDVLDRHGYARADDEHVGLAILLITHLTHIHEGALKHPFGLYLTEASPSATEPAWPESAAVIVPARDLNIILAALDFAADYNRDRAVACADCTSQSCPTCQSRLRHAQAYDRLAALMVQAVETLAPAPVADPASARHPAVDRWTSQ